MISHTVHDSCFLNTTLHAALIQQLHSEDEYHIYAYTVLYIDGALASVLPVDQCVTTSDFLLHLFSLILW